MGNRGRSIGHILTFTTASGLDFTVPMPFFCLPPKSPFRARPRGMFYTVLPSLCGEGIDLQHR